MFLAHTTLKAQTIIKQGTIAFEETSVTEDLNGNNIVPPLQEDEGMIRLLVDENLFVTSDDLLEWIKSGRFTIQGLRYETNSVRKRPDESIVFKFNFRFLSGTDQVARRVQIRTDEFKTYFKSHRFYKQKVATLTLKVEEEPTYDKPLVVNGMLAIGMNVDGGEVIAIDQNGQEKGRRFAVGSSAELELPVGVYRVIIRKTGYQEKILDNIEIAKDQETAQIVDLEPMASAASQQDASKALVEFRVNADRTNLVLLSQSGTQQGLLAFDNVAKAEIEPGRYQVIATKSGFVEQSFTIEATTDSAIVENVRMVREGETENFIVRTDPPGAEVFLNEKNMGRTPVTIRKPEREIFNVRVEMKDYQTFTQTVDFALINTLTIEEKLTPSYIDFFAFAETDQISIPATVLVNGDSIGVAPMRFHNPPESLYTVILRRNEYEDYVQEVDLTDAGFASINTSLKKRKGQFRVANAQYNVPMNIKVEGKTQDTDQASVSKKGELIQPDLRYGTYDVTVSHPGFKTVSETLNMENPNQDFFYEMQPKSKPVSFVLSALIPGAGQMYWGQKGKGWLLLLGFAGAGAGTFVMLDAYNTANADYIAARNDYLAARSPSDAVAKRQIMNEKHQSALDAKDMVSTALMGVGAVYGINLLDRLLTKSPKRMMKKNKRETTLSGTRLNVNPTGMSLTIPLR